MNSALGIPRQERRWTTMFLSVALHATVLAFVSLGPAGLPWGVQDGRGDLYSLSYLGEIPGAVQAGQGPGAVPAGTKAVELRETPVVKAASPKTTVKPAPRIADKPSTEPPAKPPAKSPAKPAPASSGQLLSSARGSLDVPLTEKPVTEKPPKAEKPPETVRPPETVNLPAEPAAGAGPGGNGGGLPPPKGSGLVAGIPKLVYPKDAQNSRAKGVVGLRVAVSSDGKVDRVEVERSSGDRRLDSYAQRAIERGLVSAPWSASYVLRVEVHFLGGIPEVRVSDAPVEVGG